MRSSSGSFQMRCIMVGTAYIQSTRCCSTSWSARSASNRSMTTTWFPMSSAATEKLSGPLWYSGPLARCTPSGVMPNARAVSAWPAVMLGPPATMSLGRPVLPPDVGAFHAAATFTGSGASDSSGSGVKPAGIQVRPGASRPTTRLGSASSTIASSSSRGSLAETGAGVAPSFQAAIAASNHSIPFGRPMVTKESCVTPSAS